MGREIERIGFVLHAADLFNHYKNVLAQLSEGSFELIITPSVGASRKRLVDVLNAEGYPHVELGEILKSRKKYRVLVTNHPISGGGMYRYLPEKLGQINVRFMYAIGKARHNFSAWNLIYDMILCHGPYQAKNFGFCRRASVVQMGYPRYDHYFDLSFDKRAFLQKLGADPSRPTILWVPTWSDLSSLDLFLDSISSITDEYNVLIKPHPLTVSKEPHRIERIKRTNLSLISDELTDITELYAASDFVLSDYGGTIFSALYLDKPLLLLNMPNAEKDKHTGINSPDIEIREDIANLSHKQSSDLRAILKDDALWDRQARLRRVLRDRYFAPYYGYSSKVAAAYLCNAPTLIPPIAVAGPVRKYCSVRARKLARGEYSIKSILSRWIGRNSAPAESFSQ